MTRSHRQRYERSTRESERRAPSRSGAPTPAAEVRLKQAVRDVLVEFADLASRGVHVEVEAVRPVGRPLQRLEAHVVLHLLPEFEEPIDDPWGILGGIDDEAQVALNVMLGESLDHDGPVVLEIVTLITR